LKTLFPSNKIFDITKKNVPFIELRLSSDIEQIVKRFTSKRKRSLPYIIFKYNKQFEYFQKRDARNALSFKKLMKTFKEGTASRLITEQRIMVDAFNRRGRLDFKDCLYPHNIKSSSIPTQMARAEGKRFADPHDVHGVEGSTVPGGYKISKLRFVISDGLGIVGWQLFWNADGCHEIESRKRGKWHGGSTSTVDISIPADDFILGLEYNYEGAVIMGIRLLLHLNGFTSWIGQKANAASLTYLLQPDESKMVLPEGIYVPAGEDEMKSPGVPLKKHIFLFFVFVSSLYICI
jgi:hypothetical protein